MLLFLFLTIIPNSYSGTIECSSGNCSFDSNLEIGSITDSSNTTNLWVNRLIDDTFNLIVPNNEIPRNSFIYFNSNNKNNNLGVYTGSSVTGYSGADSKIVTDILGDVTINSSGLSGVNGKNSTRVCAEKFSSGYFGVAAQTYWNNRSSGEPIDDCSLNDISWANDQFSCPIGYTLGNSTKELSRLTYKRKCSASYNKLICLNRTFDITCRMNLARKKCGNQIYSLADHNDYYFPKNNSVTTDVSKCLADGSIVTKSGDLFDKVFRVSENLKNQYNSEEDLCNYLISNETKFNASWDYTYNDNGVWVTVPTYTKDVSYIDDSTKNQFYFPLPDNITDSNNNTIAPADIRIGLKAWDTGNFGTISQSITTNGKKMIKNCLGLDGSALNDFLCDRDPGEAFDITFNIIDSNGRVSRDLVARIPEGRYRWYYIYQQTIGVSPDPAKQFNQTFRGITLSGGYVTLTQFETVERLKFIGFIVGDAVFNANCSYSYYDGYCDPNSEQGHYLKYTQIKDYY